MLIKPISVSLEEALELNRNIVTYVMPDVSYIPKDNSGKSSYDEKLSFFLSTIIKGKLYFINKGLDMLGDSDMFRAGMQVKLTSMASSITMTKVGIKTPNRWRTGGKFKNLKVCHGSTVLIYAPPGKGKTYAAEKLSISFEKEGATMYRLLFGERRDDTVGPGTVDCDSSATVEYQMGVVYRLLTYALVDAYSGKKVCLVIDSLTRIIEALTDKYSDTHMVSGGVSAPVKKMVSNLFRMGGQYGEGMLTIIGTALNSRDNNSWKNITTELKSAANAEILPEFRDGGLNSTRRVDDTEYVVSILGWKPKIFGRYLGL